MTNELAITNNTYEFTNTKLRRYTEQIFRQGLNIKKAYAQISVILAKIDTAKCFETDGFESVHDYSKKVLGLSQSTSYALLKIGYEYIDSKSLESVLKHEQGNDFSTSQLQVLLPLKSVDKAKELAENGKINPNMSVKEIKAIVKEITNPVSESDVIDIDDVSEYSENEEIKAKNSYQLEFSIEFGCFEDGTHMAICGTDSDDVISYEECISMVNEWFNR